jgi:UDP-N-acetylglucosamine--N-acetylmuramyl-(pentapeptide) pyrophosphoryl-undecaprenol N-acetylglucosamine transferase
MLGIALVIHEQNAVPGLTNRLLGRVAGRVLEAYPGSFAHRSRARYVGNPVRGDIAALPAPEVRFSGRTGPLRVLVLGGSLGAQALNETLPAAVARLSPDARPHILHQAGPRHIEAARAAYARHELEAQIEAYIADMAQAYGWADVVVCRAGALTVAELAAAGVGAVLVPYPHAVDDHQTRNAAFLADAGAAEVIQQAVLDAGELAERFARWAGDRDALCAMACKARALARTRATEDVVEACLELSAENGQ